MPNKKPPDPEEAELRSWPADKVERWPTAKLLPDARNARTHSAQQVAQIAAAVTEWGWTVPVLVDEDGKIIAGHGRILAARKLGIEAVPVMVAHGWTDAQKRAYALADNRIALGAGWDEDLLRSELDELSAEGFDMALTGFDAAELDDLMSETPEPSSPGFKEYDETIEVEHHCPKCGYSFSGGKTSRTRKLEE